MCYILAGARRTTVCKFFLAVHVWFLQGVKLCFAVLEVEVRTETIGWISLLF